MVGLFKRNKSKGFYMELDESGTSTPEQAALEQKPEPAKAETTVETATVEATAVASDSKSARQAKKEQLAKAKAEAKAQKQAEAEAKKKAAAPEPTPVAANSAAAVVNNKAKGQPETTFATKYVPMIMPRRRPGPSMNKFMDMAAQVQTPRF